MTRLEERLLAWAERRLDVELRATLSELEEERRDRDGAAAARRWRRRELRRALFHAVVATPGASSRGSIVATMARELRFALRRLRRLPAHALTFAAIVGTGIGMGTFMVETRADLIAPEDGVRTDAARLTWVTDTGRPVSGIPVTGRELWLDGSDDGPFSGISAIWPSSGNLETPVGILRVQGERVLPGHIGRLGGRLVAGRALEAPGEMVVSHDLWTRRFESDPGVIGRTVRLGDRSATIVGVAEPGFKSPICCLPPAFWEVREPTEEAATASIFLIEPTDAAAEAWAARAIEAPAGLEPPVLRHPNAAPFGGESGMVRRVLAVLLGLAATVWVTTLLTGANLIVADTLSRRKEYRLRSALGARGAEIGARLVTEAALLAAAAAVFAVGVAWALAVVAPWLLPILGGATGIQVTIGRGTLGVAAVAGAVSAVVAVLPGMAVALHLARSSNVDRGPSRSRFAAVGLGVQVALAATLVVVTGLFLTTLRSLDGEFVGFRNGGTAVHFISATDPGSGPTAGEVLAALRTTSALTARLPVYGAAWDSVTTAQGEAHHFALETVTPGFFDVVGTTLIAGRAARGPTEAVVSRDLARELGWGDRAVGQTLLVGDSLPLWISGVVEEATWGGGEVRPTVYRGWGEEPVESAVLLARGTSVASLLPRLRPLALALRPFETLDGMLVRSRVREVFLARLALAFGIVGLLVAAGAVHSHFLRWVRERERDLSIRRALGAPFARIGRFLLRGALILVVPGAVAGIGLGAVASRLLSTWLGPLPAVTASLVAVTVGTLALVTALALVGPLRRARRIHPMAVLRES